MVRRISFYVFGTLLAVMFLWHDAAYAVVPRLLPLGDSITEGWPPEKFPAAYRGYLQEILGAGAYDFVGPYSSGTGSMDSDHAGIAGEETGAILARLREYLNSNLADEPPGSGVLIHAGTNDMSNGNSVDSAFTNIQQMVEAIAQNDSTITIYLGTIVPIIGGQDSSVQALNTKIRQYVASSSLPQLFLVDHYNAFTARSDWASTLMNDSLHPNAAGLQLMAQTWARAIKDSANWNVAAQTGVATQETTNTTAVTGTDTQATATIGVQTTNLSQSCAASFNASIVQNPFLVPARDMVLVCGDSVTFTTGAAQTYTYKTAYVTTDSDNFTDTITLTGATDATGQWIIGPAQGTVPTGALDSPNYIAVYACEKTGSTFVCGCTTDGQCSQPTAGIFHWFVQMFIPFF